MYEEKQLSFFANVGNLVEPTTQQTFLDKEVELPTSIFAHNYAQRAAQSQDPNNDGASGILGRAFTSLQDRWRCCDGCNDAEADDVWGDTCVEGGSCPSRYLRTSTFCGKGVLVLQGPKRFLKIVLYPSTWWTRRTALCCITTATHWATRSRTSRR